ncbi:MAG: RluA family pseudouridine synthase [Candidatus Fermentibacteraceae bacterium]|nr:RluA family pseudouridine synthase [Candidatus Fermentibacteraceae bacterium]
MEYYRSRVEDGEVGLRLDAYLVMQDDIEESRSYISTLISNGHVTIDGETVTKPAYNVSVDQEVVLEIPDAVPIDLSPEPMELDIVYEDRHLLVVNKPAGLVIHPSGTCHGGTLVNALLAHCDYLSGISGELRPGIVHRLDKDTTGLMMVAKDNTTHRGLSEQLSSRTVKRRYLALVWHTPVPGADRIDAPIGRDLYNRQKMGVTETGKRAVTNYRILKKFRLASMIECRLETGRTHQIRVHMAVVKGCPIIADEKYGGNRPGGLPSTARNRELVEDAVRIACHQMLHAETLGFVHPVTEQEMEFNEAPPLEFRLVMNRLAKDTDD